MVLPILKNCNCGLASKKSKPKRKSLPKGGKRPRRNDYEDPCNPRAALRAPPCTPQRPQVCFCDQAGIQSQPYPRKATRQPHKNLGPGCHVISTPPPDNDNDNPNTIRIDLSQETSKKVSNGKHTTEIVTKCFPIVDCDGGKGGGKRRSKDKQCSSSSSSGRRRSRQKRTPMSGDRSRSQGQGGRCEIECCDHGVPFHTVCCPPAPPVIIHAPAPPPKIIKEAKPIVIVNNTDVCDCESKWKLIERWQAAAQKRDQERKKMEEEYEKERAHDRYKKRFEADKRYKHAVQVQRDLHAAHKEEECSWRKKRADMEDRRLRQEYEMWLEDLRDEEQKRFDALLHERRVEAKEWREQQFRTLSNTNMAVPELEELRRLMAPVDKGPNEIFEYYALEPQDPPPPPPPPPKKEEVDPELIKKIVEEQAKAIMGLTKSDGIHISLGDSGAKRANIRVNMIPCAAPNGPCCGPCGPIASPVNIFPPKPCCPPPPPPKTYPPPLVPPEMLQVLLQMNEGNSPCMRFKQTSPPWTELKGELTFPPGQGGLLAPYYCGTELSPFFNYYTC